MCGGEDGPGCDREQIQKRPTNQTEFRDDEELMLLNVCFLDVKAGSRLMRDECGVFLQQNTVSTACLLCSANASFGSLVVQENRLFFSLYRW